MNKLNGNLVAFYRADPPDAMSMFIPLSTPSLISPSFQGGPTIFYKGNCLKQTRIYLHTPLRCLKDRAQAFQISFKGIVSNQTGMLNQIR